MNADSKIRTAVIGGGNISRKHLAALRQLDTRFELVGVCDSSAARREDLEQRTGLVADDSMVTCLDRVQPELVILGTPSGLHCQQTRLAAQRGVHVACEKPLATNLGDAEQMVQCCEEAGVHLFAIRQLRQRPAHLRLKELLETQSLGAIYHFGIEMVWNRNQEYYRSASWRGTQALDGGLLLNQGIHWLDLALWMLGPAERVSFLSSTMARTIETEDIAVLHWKWATGTLGSAICTVLGPAGQSHTTLRVLGEHGSVLLRDGYGARAEWNLRNGADPEPTAAPWPPEIAGTHHSYFWMISDVLRKRTISPAPVSGREALTTLKAIFRAYASAAA